MRIALTIPGDPMAQPRGKIGRVRTKAGREFPTMRDPKKAKEWKQAALIHMLRQLEQVGAEPPYFPEGTPLLVRVLFLFRCPKGDHRKREPVPRRPKFGERNDIDNLQKAIFDAGNGALWSDDGQIVRVEAEKYIAAQGEEPRIELVVEDMR